MSHGMGAGGVVFHGLSALYTRREQRMNSIMLNFR